jgi:hypothetical protein
MPRWDTPGAPASERPSSQPPLTSRNDSLARKPLPRQAANLQPNPMLGEERYVDPVFDQPMTSPQAKAQPQPVPPPPQRHPLRGRPASERTSDERHSSERPATGDRRSLLDSGLAGLRNALAESSELGGATGRSTRPARENYADGAPSPREFDRVALNIPDGRGQDDMLQDAPVRRMLEPAIDDETQSVPSRVRMSPLAVGEEAGGKPKKKGSARAVVKILLVLLLLGGLAGSLLVLWPTVSELYSSLRSSTPVEVASEPTVSTPSTRPKIAERFEPGGQPAGQPTVTPAPQPTNTAPAGAAVAQRVVLYEEDPNDPQGKRFVGSAIWRTETVSPGPGQAAEVAVRADVEIPERRIAMTWSLRRNSDPNLPASHTVEIMFRLPQDFPSGGVSNVPGILMKQAEQSRGTPLSGLAVKVTTGFFLIGLSSTEADRERNVQLLKERAWFDIPVVYGNNRRAILALEKGTPGERAFEEAFKAWKQ